MQTTTMNGYYSGLSRRDFLRLAALGSGSLAFRLPAKQALPEFPQANYLGCITVGKMDVYTRPDSDSHIVGVLYEDNVIPWVREVVGAMSGHINHRFIETPNGHVWGGYVQPVLNLTNAPVVNLTKPAWEQACGWK